MRLKAKNVSKTLKRHGFLEGRLEFIVGNRYKQEFYYMHGDTYIGYYLLGSVLDYNTDVTLYKIGTYVPTYFKSWVALKSDLNKDKLIIG